MVLTEMVKEEQAESHGVHNPIVASFVTSYGRKVLFEGLVKCGKRALYCDTDSIIFISKPEKRHVEPREDPNSLLGNWVNELGPGEFIRVCITLSSPLFPQISI